MAASLTPNVVVTGLQLDKYIACAGAGRDRFVVKKLHIARSFPGTGDLYGAVLIGSLIQGNALSAAADNAAEFVALAIQKTPCDQDTRFAHPAEHRQRGPHLRLHGLPPPSGGADGLCHRR